MPGLRRNELRDRWIAKAQMLDRSGHFEKYSRKQRHEVLKKGFLGLYPPDQAITIATEDVEQGYELRTG